MQLQGHHIRLMKYSLAVLFALVAASGYAQIAVRYPGAKKALYHRGDTLSMVVLLKLNPKSCLDGMKKTYVYYSGCENVRDKGWKQLPSRIFQKEIIIRITDNARDKAKVTITRDTDKESFFRQEVLNIR
jgi:hypothetical protein